MGLSSNSLIHFTNSKDALIGILKEEFKIKYCLEKVKTTGGDFNFAIPMVSFCDIPLSEIKEHIKKYGTYGIGLRKEWGQRHGLNPVLYVEQNSTIGQSYRTAFKEIFKSKKVNSLTETEQNLLDVVRYFKNYESELIRNGDTIPNYRFADEKEWRYVPKKEDATMVVTGKRYSDNKRIYNDKIQNLRLGFDPTDISYVIIKEDSEISEFIDVLKKAKGKKYSYEKVERLVTRLITVDQIIHDF